MGSAFIDMLSSFWYEKVQGEGQSRRRPKRRWKLVEFHLVIVEWLT